MKREEEEEEGRDRLSQLPDDILINILLPLLDLKTLTLTSTLSTRWRNLYLSTARHLNIFHITVPDARYPRSSASSAVSKALFDLQHLVKITGLTVTIRISYGADQSRGPRAALRFALSRDVEHLNFRPHFADDYVSQHAVMNLPFSYSKTFGYNQRRQYCSPFYSKAYGRWYLGLPRELSASRWLKTLRLHNCHLPEQRFRLPATVTGLHADRCLFEDGNRRRMLFDFNTISPGLEELTIFNCDFVGEGISWLLGTEERVDVKIIGGSKLKSLTIKCNKFSSGYCTPTKISAPVLTSFRLVVHVLRQGVVSVDFPSLKNAVVDFFEYFKETNFFPECSDQEERDRVCADLCRLLQGLHNSESLSLSSTVIKALNAAPPEMLEEQSSPFVRLKRLKIGGVDNPEGNLPELCSEVKGYLLGGSPGAELVSSLWPYN
ncbi:hypothetical protein Tsubulata_047005 [Turnera subulata]|uniref:F-box domain-containing protein n=1 Tax=Turnera subulata TaxID=218843 RepID=A0A9Q0G4B3_9ROSI|nr:hypothetical protein Tsubulata_047005 [Turnera subulata]